MEPKEALEKFLHSREILKELRRVVATGQKSLSVSFEQLIKYEIGLGKYLLDRPSEFFADADAILEGTTKVAGMHLRVKELDKSVEIRNIRAKEVGKFIQVEGIVVRASEVKPEAKEAVFRCRRCGEENRVPQSGEFFREPLACVNPNCLRRGDFEFVVESTVFGDWQSLCIQEPPEKLRGGRMPQRLDGIARDDLVDKVVPGNRVVLTGELRVFQEGRRKERKRTFRKILFINYIDAMPKGVEEAELSPEDEKRIKELAKDPWLRDRIIGSIAPTIFGYEAIKEAIALQLFGSNPLVLPDGRRIRGDTHILLTGDPAVAKSQLLRWVSEVAPRGLYTSGVKATGAGLTAAAVRDEIGGGWALEAGALVIADGGLASIDEFEKMSAEDAGAILESLEQQTVSVAKAGIVATLNTRTAVLAAANPKYGRFDPNLTLSQQIALDPVILSRFDLIFIMRDVPHPERDRAISRHILELHRVPKKVAKVPIDVDLLRKIIIYARKNLDPKFEGEEPTRAIEDFFVEWRKVVEKGAPLPITVRQLEALIRLAKANARLRLSDRVTVEDVNRAIMLVETSLRETGIDVGTGKVDIDVWMTGKPKSQREKIQRVFEIIEKLENEHGAAPIEEIRRLVESESPPISWEFAKDLIEREKMRGYLYEPKTGMIKRTVK